MKSSLESPKANAGRATSASRSLGSQTKALVDNRPQLIAQRKLQQDIASKVGSPVQFRSRTPLRRQALARNEQGGQGAVLQAIFTYKVNPSTLKIEDARYDRRNGGNRFLTGNTEQKHITADTVKAKMFDGFNGKRMDEFADTVLSIADSYGSMPSLKLLPFHKLSGMTNDKIEDLTGNDLKGMGLNGNMSTNFLLLRETIKALPGHKTSVKNANKAFKAEKNSDKQKARALELDYAIKKVLDDLDIIRDGMPLVNILSGIQSRGKEPEARKFLDKGISTKGVTNELTALWAFFDTAAIEQLTSYGQSSGKMEEAFQQSFSWVDFEKLNEESEIKQKDFYNYFAAHMIANHITLIEHSYPDIARSSGLIKPSSLKYLLEKSNAGIDVSRVIDFLGKLVDLEDEDKDEAEANYTNLNSPIEKKGEKRKKQDESEDEYLDTEGKNKAKRARIDAKKKVKEKEVAAKKSTGKGKAKASATGVSKGKAVLKSSAKPASKGVHKKRIGVKKSVKPAAKAVPKGRAGAKGGKKTVTS